MAKVGQMMEILGALPPTWDGSQDYSQGAQVYWDQHSWSPGSSDAWTVIGSTIIGMFDIQVEQRKMNDLKQVPVSVAKILLKNGQWAIDHAKTIALDKGLPGVGARDKVATAMTAHAVLLASASNPSAIYAGGDALKRDTMQAFIEANAADEGAAYLQSTWDAMWKEIGEAIKQLPVAVAKAVNQAASSLLGIPTWGIGVGVGVIVLGLGIFALRTYGPRRK
jgi:hypothetical protein